MFRALTANDQAEIADVFRSRATGALTCVNWTVDSITRELSDSKGWGYFQGTRLEAFILYKDMSTIIEILLIFSRPGSLFAGQKVLQSLIDARSQLGEVWLEVHEDNQKAIAFYKREGFQQTGRRLGYYPDGKSALNFCLYVKPKPL